MDRKKRMYSAFFFMILGILLTIFALKISTSFDSGGQESFIFLFYLLLFAVSGLLTWWVCMFILRFVFKKKM